MELILKIHALILNTGQRNILMIYLKKTVIIGDSLQNGFIVMICDGNNDGVYYYDDSYYFDESNDENNVYIISNNFTEFLDMIVKR